MTFQHTAFLAAFSCISAIFIPPQSGTATAKVPLFADVAPLAQTPISHTSSSSLQHVTLQDTGTWDDWIQWLCMIIPCDSKADLAEGDSALAALAARLESFQSTGLRSDTAPLVSIALNLEKLHAALVLHVDALNPNPDLSRAITACEEMLYALSHT